MFRFHHRARMLAALVTPLLLASLAGCGAASGLTPGATPTVTVAATATSTALPTLPTVHVASSACGPYSPADAVFTPAGGLVVTQKSTLGNLAYPDTPIPSGQSAQPIRTPEAPTSGPIVNPRLQEGGGGFVLLICNPSSQPHTFGGVQASIARITPYTGSLQAWAPCSGFYISANVPSAGGCGGSDPTDADLHAPFAADAQVGATVTATQTSTGIVGGAGNNGQSRGPLPQTLNPGDVMLVEIGVTHPSAPGYYTYAFALTVDGASTGVGAYSPTVLLAPVAHAWSGANCQSPAMQAQIAQMEQETPPVGSAPGFICP